MLMRVTVFGILVKGNLGFLKPLFSKGVNDWKMISTIILFIGIEKFGWRRVDLLILYRIWKDRCCSKIIVENEKVAYIGKKYCRTYS
jgi:hypothetical protein